MQHPRREHVAILRLLTVLAMVIATNLQVPTITQATTSSAPRSPVSLPAARASLSGAGPARSGAPAPSTQARAQVRPLSVPAPATASTLAARVRPVQPSHAVVHAGGVTRAQTAKRRPAAQPVGTR